MIERMRAPVSERMRQAPLARRRWRGPAILAALFVALLLLDALLYQITLPVSVTSDGARLTIEVGGVTQRVVVRGRIVAVSVPARDPVIHEFQLDGSDATNNFTLDPTYLDSIATTPYYRFYTWMRDLDGLSRWRDLCVSDEVSGGRPAAQRCVAWAPLRGASLLAPANGAHQRITITARLQRPERPVALLLTMSDGSVVTIALNRNDRYVRVSRAVSGQDDQLISHAFFPTDTAPFAAMTLDTITRVALWALAALALIWGGELLIGMLLGALGRGVNRAAAYAPNPEQVPAQPVAPLASGIWRWLTTRWRALTRAIHPLGLAALAASFVFVVWIALAQYLALPHIYDASAYLFGAKLFAEGRLWAPAPALADYFPGPFMVIQNGKWFPQYEPGTALTLALGVRLGAPWLIEPLMGTLALLGVGLIARRLYNRRVATLAVLLGAVSPFYSYLAASYLSHAVALCYLVWGFWALLRALGDARGRGGRWYLPLAGLLWLMASLTRDTTAIFAVVAAGGALWLAWRGDWPALRDPTWREWGAPLAALLGVGALGLAVYLGYNAALTGSPFITPRMLFFPGDHYGFGQGVGFYGQHTLAAGFVNLDELLTSLAISLYGWPFYLTLAFLLIPLLTRRAVAADVVMLVGAAALTFAFIGYFYPGIYLGPRYLFEALPFLLILTARGLISLAETGLEARALGASLVSERRGQKNHPATGARRTRGVSMTGALGLALLACWATFYLPRQIALHTSFTGMGVDKPIQTSLLAHPPLRHALVVTGDSQLYGYTLFGLNDPLLRGNVIYAEADSASGYAALHQAFPDRRMYVLIVNDDGTVTYAPVQLNSATP
ncbi:MAG TPA: glycosyltransferase family 39 protein [Ktedonobacterales bacterium]